MHDIKSDAFIRSNCDYFENILYYALLFLRKAIGVDFVVYKSEYETLLTCNAYRTYTS